MVRPFNPGRLDVWVKKQLQSGARCQRFSSICGSKRGSNSHFWPYKSFSSRWYVPLIALILKKKAFLFKDETSLMFLEDLSNQKEGRRCCARKDQSCLALGDNLVDFSQDIWSWSRQEIGRIAQKISSSSPKSNGRSWESAAHQGKN